MMQLLADMLPAAMLGLFIAMPLGPICLMCVQRTLTMGIRFGIASGMGAAVAHGVFSLLAVASAAMLAQTALTVEVPLRLAAGLALIFMGLKTCLVPARPAREARRGHLCSAFISTLLIAAANPMTMLPYLAIAAVPQAANPLIISRGFAVPIGVILGSASWYLVDARASVAAARAGSLHVWLLIGTGVLAAAQIGKAIISVPMIRSDLALGLDLAGLIVATFATLGAIAGIGAGVVVARFGARQSLIGGMAAIALGNIFGAGALDELSLLAARIVEAIGFLGVVLAIPSMLATNYALPDQTRNEGSPL